MSKDTMAPWLFGLALAIASAGCDQASEKILGYETPEWTAKVELSDGRVFVTDTRIALDVAWAEPETLPTGHFPAEGIEYAMERVRLSGTNNSFGLGKLKEVGVDGALRGPQGLLLDPKHVEYLRSKFMFHDVQLAARGLHEDVIIFIDGDFAGAIAPMKLER